MALYKENKEFRILSAIGIILVVAGHLGYDAFDIGGLFPYYSFHVFIFLFVSGYFYKEEAEDRIVSYIWGGGSLAPSGGIFYWGVLVL